MTAGAKRRRSDSMTTDRGPKQKPKRTSAPTAGQAKRNDYDKVTQEVLINAAKIYDCRLSSQCPFPEKSVELAWAHECWEEACHISDVQLELTKSLIGIVSYSLVFIQVLIFELSADHRRGVSLPRGTQKQGKASG